MCVSGERIKCKFYLLNRIIGFFNIIMHSACVLLFWTTLVVQVARNLLDATVVHKQPGSKPWHVSKNVIFFVIYHNLYTV